MTRQRVAAYNLSKDFQRVWSNYLLANDKFTGEEKLGTLEYSSPISAHNPCVNVQFESQSTNERKASERK